MTIEMYLKENPNAANDIRAINKLFEPYGIEITDIVKGSQIIRYKLQLPEDAKANGKLRRAEKDIEYSLSVALKCDDIIYNKSENYVYVERKADNFEPVKFESLISNLPKKGYYLLLGKDIDGKVTYTNLSKAPHILVGGTTGSGKSELLHTFIASLIYRRNDNMCTLFIIDPKRAEYSAYKNRNGVYLITDMSEAVDRLKQCCDIMEKRYQLLEEKGCKDISEVSGIDPIIVVVDELADLLMHDKTAEKYIIRLAQKARACGIHLILGTQRPSKDVVTGLIKANIPTKIALKTTDSVQSRIILDRNGSDKLFGKGDMLFLGNGAFNPVRIQTAYVTNELKNELASHLSYEEHAPYVNKPTSQEDVYKQYAAHGYDLEGALNWAKDIKNEPAKNKKHVGPIRKLINLMKVKPVMIQSDEYPLKWK